MTNKEKASELVLKITSKRIDLIPSARNDAYDVTIQMAEWKDEQFAAEKKVSIEKACDTYCKVCGHFAHTVPTHICRLDCRYYTDFRKTMEE